jgi:hypothetical protein
LAERWSLNSARASGRTAIPKGRVAQIASSPLERVLQVEAGVNGHVGEEGVDFVEVGRIDRRGLLRVQCGVEWREARDGPDGATVQRRVRGEDGHRLRNEIVVELRVLATERGLRQDLLPDLSKLGRLPRGPGETDQVEPDDEGFEVRAGVVVVEEE